MLSRAGCDVIGDGVTVVQPIGLAGRREPTATAGNERSYVVGTAGFEPATSCPPDTRANQAAPRPVFSEDSSLQQHLAGAIVSNPPMDELLGSGRQEPIEGSLRGQLLVSTPTLNDPNFSRTVVLIAEHSGDGAMGLILNRPLEVLVQDAVEPLAQLVDQDDYMYQGGPVEPQAVLALAEFVDPSMAASLAFGQIGFVSADPDVDTLGPSLVRTRVFAGYAGWGAGQLEAELKEEAWVVEIAHASDVFAEDAELLWASVLRRRGAIGEILAMMPPDPSVN